MPLALVHNLPARPHLTTPLPQQLTVSSRQGQMGVLTVKAVIAALTATEWLISQGEGVASLMWSKCLQYDVYNNTQLHGTLS